jgi:hypothetical protein
VFPSLLVSFVVVPVFGAPFPGLVHVVPGAVVLSPPPPEVETTSETNTENHQNRCCVQIFYLEELREWVSTGGVMVNSGNPGPRTRIPDAPAVTRLRTT